MECHWKCFPTFNKKTLENDESPASEFPFDLQCFFRPAAVFLKIIGAPFNSSKKTYSHSPSARRHADMSIWGSQITSDLYGSSHERYPSSSVLNHQIVSIWQPTNLKHQMQHLATTIWYRNIRIWIYTCFLKTKMAGTLTKSEKRTKKWI